MENAAAAISNAANNAGRVDAWAVAYDLDVKQMKTDGFTKSNVTQYYANIREALTRAKFDWQKQWSIYTSEDPSLSALFAARRELAAITFHHNLPQAVLSAKAATDYIKRLHAFRIDFLTDMLPYVANGRSSAGRDGIQEAIDEVFGPDTPTGTSADGAGAAPAAKPAPAAPTASKGDKRNKKP